MAAQPLVSIIIPTLGREQALQQLIGSVHELAGWKNLELIVQRDSWTNRQGCPKTLQKGVDRATGQYICFLGNDCRPAPNFIREAMATMLATFPDGVGLVGLNDGIWPNGEIATHWVASIELLAFLDGEFFHTGYHHVGCDNELTARCQLLNRYVWCPAAKLEHDHPSRLGWGEADGVHLVAWSRHEEDRALLRARARQFGFTHLLV